MTKGPEKPEKLELLNPKNDFLFKKLFAAPGNEDLLIDLLNSILKLKEEKKICQVTILNPIKTRDHLKDKEAIMDILARTGEGTLMTIEIQVADEHDMQKRATYYWSVVFTSQMLIGMQYSELRKTIGINILDYNFLKQTEKYHTVFHLREETENFKLTDVEEIRFIELPKMLKNWERGKLKEEEDPLTKWFLLLEAKEDQKIARALEVKAMNDAVLEKAIKEWQRLSQDPKTRAQYLSRLKWKMDYFSSMKTAESRGWERGMEKGRTEAKQDAICQFLFKRFGLDPAGIQEKVRRLTNLEILDDVLTQLFAAGSPEEAQRIIEEGLNKSLPQA